MSERHEETISKDELASRLEVTPAQLDEAALAHQEAEPPEEIPLAQARHLRELMATDCKKAELADLRQGWFPEPRPSYVQACGKPRRDFPAL